MSRDHASNGVCAGQRHEPRVGATGCKTVGSAYVGSNPTCHHLPPPAETARSLRKRGPAGRFLLVPPCIIACRCRSSRSNRYGHLADSIRAEGRSVEPLALPICARFAPLSGHPDCSPGWCMPGIPGGRFSAVLLAMDGGLVLLVLAAGAGCRIGPLHPLEAAAEAVTGCAPPAAGRLARRRGERPCGRIWAPRERRRHAAMGFPVSPLRDWIWLSRSCTCRGLVMHLSCTRPIPALVMPRIARPPGPLAAAVSEMPGLLN